MLINKAKRAEQNLKNLPFLPLQAEQVGLVRLNSKHKL